MTMLTACWILSIFAFHIEPLYGNLQADVFSKKWLPVKFWDDLRNLITKNQLPSCKLT